MLSKKLSSSEHGREISILNFEDFYPSGTPAFTESATLEALWRTGVDPRSLQVITESLLCQYPPNPDIRHSAREKLNAQRKQRIWKVMKAREEILRLEASADSVDGFKKSTRSDKMCSSANTTSLESRENRPLQSDPEWDQFIRECAKDKSSPQKRTKTAKTIALKEKAKREEKIDALRRIEEQRQQNLKQSWKCSNKSCRTQNTCETKGKDTQKPPRNCTSSTQTMQGKKGKQKNKRKGEFIKSKCGSRGRKMAYTKLSPERMQ